MTKNMKDVLIHQMIKTGVWKPRESWVYTGIDSFYMDSTLICISNGCRCVKAGMEWKLWWHLFVVEPGSEDDLTNADSLRFDNEREKVTSRGECEPLKLAVA